MWQNLQQSALTQEKADKNFNTYYLCLKQQFITIQSLCAMVIIFAESNYLRKTVTH